MAARGGARSPPPLSTRPALGGQLSLLQPRRMGCSPALRSREQPGAPTEISTLRPCRRAGGDKAWWC